MSIMLGKTSVKDLHGPLLDFMDKLQCEGGEEWFTAFKKFLRKENPWPEPTRSPTASSIRSWREEDGVIYFSVVSDGTTGEDWITRLESKGFSVGYYVKQMLRTPSFKPTNGVTTEVAVLKGMLFEDNDRITKKIRAEGALRKLGKPEPELACLIREKFTDKEIEAMGLIWIIAMHEPIKVSGRRPRLLGVDRDDGGRWVGAYVDLPDVSWFRVGGFAFLVSQVSSQS